VRQFLLKNLARDEHNRFFWRPNLKAIDEHLQEVGEDLPCPGTFDKPTLFIFGKKSNYFAEGDETNIKKNFPIAEFTFLDTGHWVQAEKPQEFAQTVLSFLHGKER